MHSDFCIIIIQMRSYFLDLRIYEIHYEYFIIIIINVVVILL